MPDGWLECPYCGKTNTIAGDTDFDGGSVGQKVECEDCGKMWWEIYIPSHREPYADGPFPEKG